MIFPAPARVRRPRWRGSKALVVLDPDKCARCLGPLERSQFDQLALFWHGGYGGTEATLIERCPTCELTRLVWVQTLNPLR